MTYRNDLAWFARLLGVTVEELHALRALPDKYRIYTKPKANGGHRFIASPVPQLALVQRRILHNVLRHPDGGPIGPSTHVYGAVRRGGPVRHARVHRRATHAYVLDLKDAFVHGSPSRISEALRKKFSRANWDFPWIEWICDLTTHPKLGLPQGAPTSNALFNLLCAPLDEAFDAYRQKQGLRYTRYVDEIILSGMREILPWERRYARLLIQWQRFEVHRKKIRYFRWHQGAIQVTGVSVHDERVGLSKRRIDRIRAMLHRATHDPSISQQHVEGSLGNVREVYGGTLPPRLEIPYNRFRRSRRMNSSG